MSASSVPFGVIEEDVLLFGVPKKGRIYEDVLKLLKGSGLDAYRPERLDVAMCKELPVKLVFLPAADIPSYVMEGNVDLGISGHDMLEEFLLGGDFPEPPMKILAHLGFGNCKLCLQAPASMKAVDASAFIGKRIVTSFPNLSTRFFAGLAEKAGKAATKTPIRVVSGSVEAACVLGLADAVVDLVETGTTMRAAGLEVISEPIFKSEALLFQQVPTDRNGLGRGKKAEILRTIKERIDGYLTATRFVMLVYNCHADQLANCCKITPGKRSPTITELKESGWFSVSSLVKKEQQHSLMDQLAATGAQDILCMQLTNTRM